MRILEAMVDSYRCLAFVSGWYQFYSILNGDDSNLKGVTIVERTMIQHDTPIKLLNGLSLDLGTPHFWTNPNQRLQGSGSCGRLHSNSTGARPSSPLGGSKKMRRAKIMMIGMRFTKLMVSI